MRYGKIVCLFLLLCAMPAAADDLVLVGWDLRDNGDDDGHPDTGETVTIRVRVENRSDETRTGVTARLSGDDPDTACVSQGVVVVGTIAPGETRASTAGFVAQMGDFDRAGTCSVTALLCGSTSDCPAGESCDGVQQQLDTVLSVTLSDDQGGGNGRSFPMKLALDLDTVGTATPSSFFEGFESVAVPGFDEVNMDFGFQTGDPWANSDGYRCQYSNPEWINSNSYGQITDCHLGADDPAQVDAYYWQVDGPAAADGGRAYEGVRSLNRGIPLALGLGHTTPTASLEAAALSETLQIGAGRFCYGDGSTPCSSDGDCLPGESCLENQATLSFRHQLSSLDYRFVNARPFRSADRAVVQAQIVDGAGTPLSPWQNLEPFMNVHDQQAEDNYTNCMFDPIDDGNTEDDYFDPLDPDRRLGPSSTCYPATVFGFMGSTEDSAFCPDACLGNADDGPAEPGSSGPGAWVESRFSLDHLRGQRIRLRFLATSLKVGTFADWESLFENNPDPRDDGWWIDAVEVTGTSLSALATVPDTRTAAPPTLPDGDGDGFFDVCDNCPAAANADQDDFDGDLVGDICDPCPSELLDDEDADGLCCPEDNCCRDANPLQEDGDGDGAGDVCDVDPVLLVSDDPADSPDFPSIQAAVDAAPQSGTRIGIYPGTYIGPIEISELKAIHLSGIDDGSGEPVIIEGGLTVRNTRDGVPIRIHNLTLRGTVGLTAYVDTRITGCIFDGSAQTGLSLINGAHELRDLSFIGDLVSRGLWVRFGATASLVDATFTDLSGDAIWVGGALDATNVLVTGAFSGVVVFAGGDLSLRHATLTGLTDGLRAGTDTELPIVATLAVEDSILFGNVQDVALYVEGMDDACSVLSRTTTGSIFPGTSCAGANGNLHVDPQLDPVTFHLTATSPALDTGPDPALYTGAPCTDLAGGPRLRDHDGDGLAQADMGAFELLNTQPKPPEVQDLLWSSTTLFTWSPEPQAGSYHVYRGLLSTLAFDDYGSCLGDTDSLTTQFVDAVLPIPGEGFFYSVTAVRSGGSEGSAGVGTCAERSTYNACP